MVGLGLGLVLGLVLGLGLVSHSTLIEEDLMVVSPILTECLLRTSITCIQDSRFKTSSLTLTPTLTPTLT